MLNASSSTPLATVDRGPDLPAASRKIVLRTHGQRHGPITRLLSPDSVAGLVKPFVFLDHFDSPGFQGGGFAAHPHSGIATHTTLLEGTFDYGDSTGKSGVLNEGNLEWMQAGAGVWHWGTPRARQPVRGYQLWVTLPPRLEHEAAVSQYIDAVRVSAEGPVRVLLGRYGPLESPIAYREAITYLQVTLAAGQRWTFTPEAGHEVAWLAVNRGALRAGNDRLENELVIFEHGEQAIALEAEGASDFVIGSARLHPHPLVTGTSSVHTSLQSLQRGEDEIERLAGTPLVQAAIRRTSR